MLFQGEIYFESPCLLYFGLSLYLDYAVLCSLNLMWMLPCGFINLKPDAPSVFVPKKKVAATTHSIFILPSIHRSPPCNQCWLHCRFHPAIHRPALALTYPRLLPCRH